MRIGIDLSSLQGAHRMRGIGYTLINLINHMPVEHRSNHIFVFFYELSSETQSPLDLLDLEDMTYEVRNLTIPKRINKSLPGKFNIFIKALNYIIAVRESHTGDPRIQDTRDLDAFLQTDQMISLPSGKFKKAFVAYDLIPYVLEWDYLWNYRTARQHQLPIQAAVRCSARRHLYLSKLRANIKRADVAFAISKKTRDDFIKYAFSQESKLMVTPLGVATPEDQKPIKTPAMHRYVPSSWGYLRKPYAFDAVPYLLFVGGADKRRKLDDLVTAFNHLRAQGHELKLVLAGDSMQGPKNISTEIIQQTLLKSSYIDDIVFMGFVDDSQREWLYQNALAFVFPSVYEGFGLPVLEAMARKCPVISYRNDATAEVATNHISYAHDTQSLTAQILHILQLNDKERNNLVEAGSKQALKYKWEKTSDAIFGELLN